MKYSSAILVLASIATPLAGAAAVPDALIDDAVPALVPRFSPASDSSLERRDEPAVEHEKLFRRKGGGGRSGGGSSGGSSGGGRSGSSGRGGSSGSSSNKAGSSSRGSSSSSTGGRTTTGSGTKPSYGGGTIYSGGSSVPYRSGQTSPSGISPIALGAGIGAGSVLFWPGIWYHPVYYYPYGHTYAYHNQSSNRNETKDVACACDETVECSCDDNSNSTYLGEVIGNGSYAALSTNNVSIADVNGTSTILINGTLPNGTTASGGTESASAAAGSMRQLLQLSGLAPAVVAMLAMVYVL